MPRDVARATLYRGAINLWVEDELTRAYLSEIWSDPGVAYFIGGGNEGVSAILHDAEQAGFLNVFGLIDLDFRRTNQPLWSDPNKTFRRFVLPVHEIENYLLDAAALASCRFNNLSKSAAEIDEFMKDEAARRLSWAACRAVVALLRDRFRGRFLVESKTPASSLDEAFSHICDSKWYRALSRKVKSLDERRIRRLLVRAEGKARRSLDDGSWKRDFAGKEIVHHLGSRIFDRTISKTYNPTPSAFAADLAKEVAAWQVANGTVPRDLRDLLQALKARIALKPPPLQ
jgi:hypothetical protein